MKRLMALALVFFCPLSFLTVSNAQTSPNKTQLLPYDDADGYQVLSSIIDASTNKLKSESVSIFHHTISEEAFRGVRFQCSSSIPAEFQSAAEDFDKKAKTKFLLQQEFSIQKKYKLVELSRETPANIGNHSQTTSSSATFSVSAVGFDETKAHAIALVRYFWAERYSEEASAYRGQAKSAARRSAVRGLPSRGRRFPDFQYL